MDLNASDDLINSPKTDAMVQGTPTRDETSGTASTSTHRHSPKTEALMEEIRRAEAIFQEGGPVSRPIPSLAGHPDMARLVEEAGRGAANPQDILRQAMEATGAGTGGGLAGGPGGPRRASTVMADATLGGAGSTSG